MTRISLVRFLLTAFIMLLPGAVDAQVKCREGTTSNGECVNPVLAARMRQTAIIFSQPKLSQTTFPIMPAEDLRYRYPHQLIPDPLKPAPAFTASP